ncbi:autotransporter outer membrane beta-barrel domain-containing protein [Kiritimatiellota bacterium B12222]|nr:autotransporter outer membrane beta-barrel domain-containing protein [Kiritimatiellota bacterium B12222]
MNPRILSLGAFAFSVFLLLAPSFGQVTVPVDQTLGATEGGSTTINPNAINITDGNFAIRVQGLGAGGYSSSSENAGNGASMGSIASFSNEPGADITVTQTGSVSDRIYGILLKILGGNGGDASGDKAQYNAGSGGNVGDVGNDGAASNQASITLAPGTYNGGLSIWEAYIKGGSGGKVTPSSTNGDGVSQFKDGGVGGAGGSSGSINLSNTGALLAGTTESRATVADDNYGILARTVSGIQGEGSLGINGSDAGTTTVTSSGPISLYLTGSGTYQAYGIRAQSLGNTGSASYTTESAGGDGGSGSEATVTLQQGGDILVDGAVTGSGNISNGAGIEAGSSGGAGGQSYDHTDGGTGGSGGTATVNITDATVTTSGSNLVGVNAISIGGKGGDGGVQQDYSNGGNGGNGSSASVTLTSTSSSVKTGIITEGDNSDALTLTSIGGNGGEGTNYDNPTLGVGGSGDGGDGGTAGSLTATLNGQVGSVSISTSGDNSDGVSMQSLGGSGLRGGDIDGDSSTSSDGSTGGSGGNAGAVTFSTTGSVPSTITTTGSGSKGVVLISQGGTAGRAGDINSATSNKGKTGGSGGSGNTVTFTLGNSSIIEMNGDSSFGVGIQSIGQNGQRGSDLSEFLGNRAGDGGVGGAGGSLDLTTETSSAIITSGNDSSGLVARTLSGAGGNGGTAGDDGVASHGGDAGNGGSTGTVTLSHGGSVVTEGEDSFGILLQALTGAGGNAGDSRSVFYADGGTGGSPGTLGDFIISLQEGSETATFGDGSHAIILQSIAGGGGSAGDGSGAVGLGGDSAAGGDGGTIGLTGTGNISTQGSNAIGILSQSIAGGGGTGGDAGGVITIGSNGASGGSGGNTELNLNTTYGQVSTLGQLSHAIVNQSIGGGGGNAGNASAEGPEISVAVGGTGGAGGDGGDAAVLIAGGQKILTGGSNSIGVLNQSIGGGGGSGGSAYSHSVGIGFDAAVGVGGSGGSGGTGGGSNVGISNSSIATGLSTLAASQPTNTNPVDAYGVVIQAIGGGGGAGGSATASALAVAVPVPETDTEFAVSAGASVGGSGGIGGTGGSAFGYFYDSASVTTQGQGSHGIIVQSVGGGGGVGGDSSATAATVGGSGEVENSVKVTGTFTMGGSGGGGGNGSNAVIFFAANAAGEAEGDATVVTYGDYSNAIILQSIGGGGGNAGFGSGNTRSRGGTVNIETSVNIGASGGSGGVGGNITATLFGGSLIKTYGSGSHGVVAQSIGGGGGTSQGGSLSFGAAASVSGGGEEGEEASDLDLEGSVSIALGRDGGSGSNGGTVSVWNQGSIRTFGGDSVGILAQSIGGGGGVGGGAGSDASADNPVDPSTSKRRFSLSEGDGSNDSTSLSADFSLEIGGGGGAAANGGSVYITNSGGIRTSGDWSSAILAQSIGGGGGKGGTALAANTEGQPDLSINLAVQGNGGYAGDGSGVTVNLNGSNNQILTEGYAAFGIHAQSIGGGGGIGADGSTAAGGSDSTSPGSIQLGGDFAGSGGSGGNGFLNSNGTDSKVSLSGNPNVITTDDAAHAVVLQSIGGGGGVGGTGSSIAISSGMASPSISLAVGGGSGSSGSGGTVEIDGGVANIETSGWASSGIVAQSIGGGGGLAWAPFYGQNVENAPVALGGSGSNGNGGSVSITLASGSLIETFGLFSHGIIAQSIGGGGGIAGYPNAAPTFYEGVGSRALASVGNGAGVTVNYDGYITTTGDASHGIFAQSIGGGGGFMGYEDSVNFGSSSASGTSTAGNITITQTGSIQVSGTNSVGILAQQDSPGVSSTTVNVTINGDVVGGQGSQGYGAWIITKSTNTSNLTINSGGSLSSASGIAARLDANGTGGINLNNNGSLVGNIQRGPGTSDVQINNLARGQFYPGDLIQANVRNEGKIFVGHGISDKSYGRTTITGDFVQSSGGTLIFRTDFERGQNDALKIEGDANFDGRVRPQPAPGSRILPNRRLTLIEVADEMTGGLGLDNSLGGIFDYNLGRSGNKYTIAVVGIDLRTFDSDFTENQLAMADYLEDVFLAESGSLDIFGTLDTISRIQPGQIGTYLNELTPGSTLGFGARGATEAQYFSDTVLNGPIFEGDTTQLAENPSLWARVHGRATTQRNNDGFGNYEIDSTMYQMGGQAALSDNSYLGGSIAYRSDALNSKDNVSSGNGDTVLGAITFKHEEGGWLFAGAASASMGWYDTYRRITFPGQTGTAEGSPQVQTGALAFRTAYTKPYKRIYLRPMLTLTGVYTHSSSYTEMGAGGLDLAVESADQSTLFFTPAFEIGHRTDYSNDWVLRTFIRPALDLSTSDSWEQDASFTGAPEAAGAFTTELPIDEVSMMITAGFDLQFTNVYSGHIRYEGKFSENVTTNGGSVGVKITF